MSPPVTPHHRRLHRLLGTFSVEQTLADGSTSPARAHTRMGPGERYVIADYEQHHEGRLVFSGHGVYGYDPDEACFTMVWFDSATSDGFTEPARGQWHDDNTLAFVRTTPHGRGRYTYRFTERGYTFELAHAHADEPWSVVMTCIYTPTQP